MATTTHKRFVLKRPWVRETLVAIVTLGLGFGLLPLLIYFAGSSLLGRYEGASPARIYDGVYRGLQAGSLVSWIVVLGPYGLYLLFEGLRFCWRAGTKPV